YLHVLTQVLLSVTVQHGQVGLSFYESKDSSLNYMLDTPDNYELHLLTRGLEVGKQRLLSAHLPFLPVSLSEREKMSYLSSCISFDSPLMVSHLSTYHSLLYRSLRAVGALLKCLDRRRVGVELEDSSIGVPILHKGVVKIDSDTYSALQIFKSELHPSVYKLHSGEKEGLSLYGMLNRCKCKFGSKLLRQWFLRPTRDLDVLHRRQKVMRFFTSPQNSDILSTLQSSLRNIRNIATILRRMSLSHTKVTDWQSLYKTVYSAICIRDTVRKLPQTIELFHEISEGFSDDLHYIASLISRVVDFETSTAENRFTVKPNVDPAVDEKKRKMIGLSDFLTDVARRELEHLDSRISSCCVIYIPLIGFLLSVPRLPSMVEKEDFEIEGLDFMFLSEDRLHYRSRRTKELDDLLGDLHCDIRGLFMFVQIGNTHVIAVLDLTAELDCLMAMSSASQEYGYTPPKLTNHRRIIITEGRHPLFELCSPVFVANSYHCTESQARVKIITGPNSSGKSIYLKQVGLIVFMALIGSNVPAKEAEIGLVDGIFTRMQSRESVSVGLSTFMIDLNQVTISSHIHNLCTQVYLCVQQYHVPLKAPVDVPHVLLATNFHSLLQLGLLPSSDSLSLLTLETAVDGNELVFLYQLKEGICQSSYAANIAALAGLPTNLVQRAVEVSELYRTGRPIKRTDKASCDECRSVVEQFLNLDLEDKDLDLKHFMREELLPSAGELLNH
uniref:MutS homolog 5 n=1 Tax=Sphaeramia orbicularis TaxID=375764 RepID=A0A673AVK2_9TELE